MGALSLDLLKLPGPNEDKSWFELTLKEVVVNSQLSSTHDKRDESLNSYKLSSSFGLGLTRRAHFLCNAPKYKSASLSGYLQWLLWTVTKIKKRASKILLKFQFVDQTRQDKTDLIVWKFLVECIAYCA